MVKILPQTKRMIEKNPLALATIKGNKPNVIAVACAKVVSEDMVLITDNFMKQTIDDIKSNDSVCIAVWDNKWMGYKLIGNAKYCSGGKWCDLVKRMPENRGLPAKGAVLVKVKKVIKLG